MRKSLLRAEIDENYEHNTQQEKKNSLSTLLKRACRLIVRPKKYEKPVMAGLNVVASGT